MAYSLWNDQIVEEGSIAVSPEDRGYQFGDGIYEVIKVYNGNMFTAQEHIDRFYASAEKNSSSHSLYKRRFTQIIT